MPHGSPTPTASRVAASQQRMLERGGSRVTVLLSPEATRALADIVARDGGTRTAAIERAVIRVANS